MTQVQLVSITQPLITLKGQTLTPEEYLGYIARVSSPKNQPNTNTAAKLLRYCIKHQHWSVFEQIDLSFEITTSTAIATQILRHRSAVFQQFSQRYAQVQSLEPVEFRLQDNKNRQNSHTPVVVLKPDGVVEVTLDEHTDIDVDAIKNLVDEAGQCLGRINEIYNQLLELGVAKESARFLLPQCSTTRMYMKNNLRNWIHYVQVRADGEGVQKEHLLIAKQIKKVIAEQLPTIAEALDW